MRGKHARRHVKEKTGVCLLLLSLLPLLWAGLRANDALRLNAALRELYSSPKAFQYSDLYCGFLNGGYRANIPVKDMAGELSKHVRNNTVIAGSGPFTVETMKLPVDLAYYAEPDDRGEMALEIPKGTEVVVSPDPDGGWFTEGYGCAGLPDYKRGWRCVRPFLEKGSQEDLDDLPYSYIRLETLETVLRQYVAEVNRQRTAAPWDKGQENHFVIQHLRNCDSMLYRLGVFDSPDLQYPVWDSADTLLAGLFAVLLVSGIALLAMGRRKKGGGEGSPGKGAGE